MKVCLITYEVAHKKTADVFFGLLARECFEIEFLFAPFYSRPEREVAFRHRPFQFEGVSAPALAQRYGVRAYKYEDRDQALLADWLLVCGANILESSFAKSGKILNVHAGLIPSVRGLDSFKWAIQDMKLMGNTLHIINEDADSGEILHHLETPVFREDTIETLADRHYKNEIWMLQNFDRFLDGQGRKLSLSNDAPTKRMPLGIEVEMLGRFATYRDHFSEL